MKTASLRALLDGPNADIRDTVREWLSRPGNAAAIIEAVNDLCAELRPDAGMLVEAFCVPEPALADAQPVAAVLERVAS